MNIEPPHPTVQGGPERFTGDVYVEPVATRKPDPSRFTVSRVRFTPGAHTAWHSHERGQTLHVTEGVALVGTRDGAVVAATPGQTVYTPPGEEHWHGAAPDRFMEHLAMLEDGDDPAATTTWLEHVSDDDYCRAAEQNGA